jgi:RHS repeat-associated protein
VITARDQARPRIAEVRREGDDLLVVMSEPVLPPMSVAAGAGLEPNNGNTAAQAFRLVTASGEQTPQVVFEENAPGLPFGSVFRLTPASGLAGNVTVRVVSGGLVDAWGNATQTEELSFTFTAGPVLGSGSVGVGATAPAAVPRSQIGNPWLWQGQWFDYDAGLVYIRARHFDPVTGQFLQRDPMQYEDSGNLYAGMGNNVVSHRDPSGRSVNPMNAFDAVKTVVMSVVRRGSQAAHKVDDVGDEVFASSGHLNSVPNADTARGFKILKDGFERISNVSPNEGGRLHRVGANMEVLQIERHAMQQLRRVIDTVEELTTNGKLRVILDSDEVGNGRNGFHNVVNGVSEVHLKSGLSPEKQFVVLAHELLHAANRQKLERGTTRGLERLFEEFDAHILEFGLESLLIKRGAASKVLYKGKLLQENGLDAVTKRLTDFYGDERNGITVDLVNENRSLLRMSIFGSD